MQFFSILLKNEFYLLKEHDIFLLQGSNKDNKKKYLEDSLVLISKEIGKVIKKSSYFESEAWNMSKNTSTFYNRALHIKTLYSPMEILEKIYHIELIFGRKYKSITDQNDFDEKKKYKDREIDIDILFYDHLIMHSSVLTIPHPLLHFRRFALEPMCEISPRKYHPVFHITLLEILGLCADKFKTRRI
ncbi:2-amino-4-hydroxy-6-hydroxymethyldihydropteridine diphosphokinase [Blattabacterium cuenoti]|uniref:2-amino-4-hydroxy-6- hydroxymethyldihydropteridine diphosphokinase n=1 Tax=Blattabacterium cuenoti TaxID=1653831 RepID=UPI00163CD61D|nr:2-amino-4-hydroxy-6-hydroxymethyldihydropteridine diphosphokinase [Blattabacterium cuenoti]